MQGFPYYCLAEFALEGFEHDVVGHLLKPIPFERFYRAAEKALQLLDKDRASAISINFLDCK
jgi:two-component system LytT family response regulator